MSQHYAYRVVYSQKDGAWVGLCTEFPSLSHLAATQVEAMQGIANLIAIEAAEAGVSLNRLVSYKLAMPVAMARQPAKATTKSKRAA